MHKFVTNNNFVHSLKQEFEAAILISYAPKSLLDKILQKYGVLFTFSLPNYTLRTLILGKRLIKNFPPPFECRRNFRRCVDWRHLAKCK